MKNNNNNSGGGLGIISVVQIVFLILKLCKVITWSWWAVFIPAYIGWGLAIIYVLIWVFIIRTYK